ncbi:hypothetical protein [Plebeiibacterium sediminum]|uniref:Conjugal transfer protein TraI n=1 Tax=Plebeiibacterium sediminum TaxID=2992112 RepID=A0AAE3M6X8_9BACT|nr:hypothetical protein [Plebeiobacterium sediminum]MCW3788369.1 hypothetical protein [Plebeiobacterium sediminum]
MNLLKTLIISLLLLFMTHQIQGQAIVHDPVNLVQAAKTTGELLNLGTTLAKLKKIASTVEEVKENVSWIKKTASVIELIKIIESTTCMIQNLQMNLEVAVDLGITNSCLGNFQYQINIRKLQLAVDQLNSVLTKGTKMTQAERWSIVSVALDNFTESQLNFKALNMSLEREIYVHNYINAKENLESESKQEYVKSIIDLYN